MESVEKNKIGDSAPRKIDVNFSETEKEFNAPEKTLEDIIDDELAFDQNAEPVIEEKVDDFKKVPVDFEFNEAARDIEDESEKTEDATPKLALDDDAPKEVSESGAKILTMHEEPVSKKNEPKEKKKGGKGLIGFLLGVMIATCICFVIFYLMYAQIISNDFFSGKISDKKDPVVVEPIEENIDSTLNLAFLKMNNNLENMIYSPLSIKYALSLLSEGADGNTKTEIEGVLGNLNLTKYEDVPDVLSFANSVFVHDGFEIKDGYKTAVSEKYDAEILSDPFENASNVNNWISNKTFNLLQNVMSDDQITQDTKMVLINALAIQLGWVSSFDAANTSGDNFTKADGSVVEATMMHGGIYDDGSYYTDDEITVLTKDLEKSGNAQLEFVAIMPKEESLDSFVENLSDDKIDTLLSKTNLGSSAKYGVDVTIPKFKFDYNLPGFKDDLMELGIEDAFSTEADFSEMSDSSLFVSDAIHKANIDFSEEGIKAAAVTVVFMRDGIAIQEEEPVDLTFDKPFFFEIRDKNNDEVWFAGTVYEPNLWENDKESY